VSDDLVQLKKAILSSSTELQDADILFLNIALKLAKTAREAQPFSLKNNALPIEFVGALLYLDDVSSRAGNPATNGSNFQQSKALSGILRHIPRKNGLSSMIKRVRSSFQQVPVEVEVVENPLSAELPVFPSALLRLRCLESIARAFNEINIIALFWKYMENQSCSPQTFLGTAYFLKAMTEHLENSERHGAILVYTRAFSFPLFQEPHLESASIRNLGAL